MEGTTKHTAAFDKVALTSFDDTTSNIGVESLGIATSPAFIGLSNEGLNPDEISPIGYWSFSWGNAAHTSATLQWNPETGGRIIGSSEIALASSGGVGVPGLPGIHVISPAASLGAYLGAFAMTGTCGLAIYDGVSGNDPEMIIQGTACAQQAYDQYENGNVGGVLSDISQAQNNEAYAATGGISDIGYQLWGYPPTGPATETIGNNNVYSGESTGEWGNDDTFGSSSGGPQLQSC